MNRNPNLASPRSTFVHAAAAQPGDQAVACGRGRPPHKKGFRMNRILLLLPVLAASLYAGDSAHRLTASIIPSGFNEAHDSYNAVSTASNGSIYYVLSSEKPDLAAQMFVCGYARRSSMEKL